VEQEELDLTSELPGTSVASLSVVPYDPHPVREKMRAAIALLLLALLGLVLAGGFITLWLGYQTDDLIKLLTLVFTPLVTLVGTSIGFYYGGKTTN
jgi:hypothetical protein